MGKINAYYKIMIENQKKEKIRSSCGPPKGISLRDFAYFEPLCVKIHPGVTSAGESLEK